MGYDNQLRVFVAEYLVFEILVRMYLVSEEKGELYLYRCKDVILRVLFAKITFLTRICVLQYVVLLRPLTQVIFAPYKSHYCLLKPLKVSIVYRQCY